QAAARPAAAPAPHPAASAQIRPPVTPAAGVLAAAKPHPAAARPPAKAAPNRPDYEPAEPEDGADTGDENKHVEADASYYGQTGGTYVIQRGDTLWKIAKKLLGSTKRWREIARANPQMNPNKLIVGSSINVPGLAMDPRMGMPNQNMIAAGTANMMGQGMGGSSFDANAAMTTPSYEPPPLVPPPPPAYGAAQPYGSAQPYGAGQPYGAPPAYGAPGGITPPPPPPVTMPQAVEPPSPYMSAPTVPAPFGAAPAPVTTSLYREERYRIPDELKPTDYSPYYGNFNGAHGLLETESALIPYRKTWHFGLHFRYDKYKYLNGTEDIVDGRQWVAPINLLYTGKKMWFSVVIPFQSWEVTSAAFAGPTVSMSGAHDPELKAGYQIWKNYEGTHAVTLHIGGRFPTDNYHQPLATLTGKTRTGIRIGPANATRGGWAEFGGAYSGKLSDRWTSHVNLALANDSEDSITRYMYKGTVDYRVNHHYSLILELNGTTWEMDAGPDGANVDLTPGMVLFNEGWQGVLGFPISLDSNWGYGHDFGVTFGLNTRWD
ncbi:MAG: LysM peptidoglycan-binding domain-containing protein, partial [Candidatus Riflebacteria bacterium]|nr:LysM peptidoglycan-binding domain-containing protein [Candidatus Riflebacteria bacterium]